MIYYFMKPICLINSINVLNFHFPIETLNLIYVVRPSKG